MKTYVRHEKLDLIDAPGDNHRTLGLVELKANLKKKD